MDNPTIAAQQPTGMRHFACGRSETRIKSNRQQNELPATLE